MKINIFGKPISSISAVCVRPGDIVHEADNEKLRGLVTSVGSPLNGDDLIRVRTVGDRYWREIPLHSLLLVTRGGYDDPS